MGEFSDFALVPEQGVVPRMEQLDADMQRRIADMAAQLDVRDGAAVLGFGARAQKAMGLFADMALNRMMDGEGEPLDDVLKSLSESIRSCSFAAEAKGFFRRMMGKSAPLDEVREAYERAEPKISACADEMLHRRVALMNDCALLGRLYDRNEALYRELCSLIVVGEEAIRQAKARGEAAETVARLERRVEDIRVTQLSSTQMAAQIRMVQESDKLTCERLKTAIDVTIPLWKSQMAAALGLARATDAMRMHSRVSKEAARGMKRGANTLREQSAAYGAAAAEGDRVRAQQTADELLREIEHIEQELKDKKKMERSV